jgi:plasmid maintenance system antidote protein VapI
MARTKYSESFGKAKRDDKTLERAEYLSRTREFALRGQDLPQAKLLDIDVHSIKSAVRQREQLRKHIADNLSNKALAKIYGVHYRTIEKIVQCTTWSHVL